MIKTIKNYKINTKKIIFQHDNDPKHNSKKAKIYLNDLKLMVLDWPPQSLDLNTIEHLWAILKRKLKNYFTPPQEVYELWERVKVEWGKISQNECILLIESTPKRIKAVLKAKLKNTKY